MRVPISNRTLKFKRFYIFFAYESKYHGLYSTIEAYDKESAKIQACQRWGLANIGSIESDEMRALGKIIAYKFKEI